MYFNDREIKSIDMNSINEICYQPVFGFSKRNIAALRNKVNLAKIYFELYYYIDSKASMIITLQLSIIILKSQQKIYNRKNDSHHTSVMKENYLHNAAKTEFKYL